MNQSLGLFSLPCEFLLRLTFCFSAGYKKMNPLPFNIDLLLPTPEMVKYLMPITALDTMDGKTKNFHSKGLFSVEIFGKSGEERRSRSFSYIDLKLPIFHPIIYKSLGDIKALYAAIISGQGWAKWDEDLKDFVKSTAIDGYTGYAFFMEHYKEIVFEERPSFKREANIAVINKYRNNSTTRYLLILPAGLRDFQYDKTGKPSQDEVNQLYRSALSISNMATEELLSRNPESLNELRYRLQLVLYEIYDHFKSLLEGKKKLVLGKWASRRIENGTRNVITSMNMDVNYLGDARTIGVNQTVIGLYQFMKAALPLSVYNIKNGFLQNVFPESNASALLVNKKTLKKEIVNLDPKNYDQWMTNEGLEQTITSFAMEEGRFSPLETQNHYFGLIYRGPDNTYRLFQDIDDLPKNLNKEDVSPITICQLFYLSVFEIANKLPLYVTRYPVINYGSTYPSFVYLKTTVKTETRTALDSNWNKTETIAYQFPIDGEQFVDSMSPHPTKLGRLGADFDGDMISANIVYTEEAIEEVKKLLLSPKFYIGPNGKMYFSASTDILNHTLNYMTSD
jgi:hypothetical protein